MVANATPVKFFALMNFKGSGQSLQFYVTMSDIILLFLTFGIGTLKFVGAKN